MRSPNYGGPEGGAVRSNGGVKAGSPNPDLRQVTGSGSGAPRRGKRCVRLTESLIQGSKAGEAAVPRKRGEGRLVPQHPLSALQRRVPGPWLIFPSLRPH